MKITDGKNNERSFVYDYQNQMVENYDAYGNKVSYEYNALGAVSKVSLPDGAVTKYEYNLMGQLVRVTDDCGIVYTASYDKAGRLVKEQNRADSEKSYEYDAGGRITKVLCGGEVLESYTYGNNSRTITVKDGNGNEYLYNYDAFGRLVNERNRNGLEQNYFYDEEGSLKSKNNFDGGTTTINYSGDRTVRTVRYSDGSENRFVYDMIGNITEAQNSYGKTQYCYDQAGYLIYQKDVTTGEEIQFEYDNAGNRTKLYSSNRETLYTYDKNNEVKEIFDNKQHISIKLTYDKNGREVLRQFRNKTKEETLYDKAGRPTGDRYRYRYLSDNDKNDGNRYFYLDEGSYKTTDTRYRGERTQIIINGTMAAQGTTDYGAEYFTTDLLGSIATVTNTHGTQNTSFTYDVFGSLIQGELTGTTDFGYLGKQHDQTTKLYNYGYRDYKPQAARFTTIDPIRDGNNWFAYVSNDPVNFVDILGLFYYTEKGQKSSSSKKKTKVYVFRDNDGLGDEFNSTRVITKNGKVVYVDQVGANCSEDNYEPNVKFTEPDGEYYYTTKGLTPNGDGTFDSENYHNVLRHQTDDPNIPEEIRKAINDDPGDFMDHGNQRKKDKYGPYNSNKNPRGGGLYYW